MEIEQTLMERRTIRRFQQKPIPPAVVAELIDAARVASCGGNMQRLRYVVVQDDQALLNGIFSTTAWAAFVQPRRNPEIGKSAPTAFVVLTASAEEAERVSADAGAAVMSLQLMAFARGIGCCWIGSYDHQRVDELLGLQDRKSVFLVALGYPDEQPVREEIAADGSPRYYLDENDTLHVPKYSIEAITEWL